MLFVSDYDVIPEPARTAIILMQVAVAVVSVIIGVLIYFSIKKKDPNRSRSYFFGIPLFFILVGIARTVFVYHDFFAPDLIDIPLWLVANIIVLSGFIMLNYTIETHIYPKTKHAFTIIGIVLVVLYVIAVFVTTKFVASLILYLANASQIFAPFGIYLIVAKQSTGDVKKKALIILTGLTILIVSQLTGIFSLFGILDRITTSLFGPIAALIGFSITGYGFIYSTEK